jgi:hypothetical protein
VQIPLIITFIVGSLYFIGSRRMLDTFTVAFFSCGLYFLPGLVGYTLTPVTPERPFKTPVELAPEAIGIMFFVMVSVVVSAFLWDRFEVRRGPPRWRIQGTPLVAHAALLIGVLGFIWAVLETGSVLFDPNKALVMTVVGRGHLVWEMGAAMGAVFAYTFRRWWILWACTALLLVDAWVGFRYAFAMAFIAIAWLALFRDRAFRLSSTPKKYVVGVLLGGLAIISYQNLKGPIRLNDWAEVGRRLSNPVWYASGIMTSEPFTTQTVLNEIVRNDFRTSTDHLWAASMHLIVFSPQLGAEEVRFNDLHQKTLFPTVDHGLADNIWGQFWSATGWTGLSIFVVIYNIVLAIGARALRCRDPTIRSLVVLSFAYWSFYIHRNELQVQIGYEKQVFLIWLACVVSAVLVDHFARITRPAPTVPAGTGA